MNHLENTKEVVNYLYEKGWVGSETDISIVPLSGGVSSSVWKILAGKHRWVLKQALAKLKVKADWVSNVERINIEQQAMKAIIPLVPKESVPAIIHSDEMQHLYVMTCAQDDAVPWKNRLLEGEFNALVAKNAGELLQKIHRGSRFLPPDIVMPFTDLTFFRELRIAPFHEYLIAQYPHLASYIHPLIESLIHHGSCLVHGDFSPKNILVNPKGDVVLLDFEVAHWGNPLFDIAFCLAHLLLKGWATRRYEEIVSIIQAFVCGYGENIRTDLLPHLGLILLARMDGKSPIEYIQDDQTKQWIREIAVQWITSQKNEDVFFSITKIWEQVNPNECHSINKS